MDGKKAIIIGAVCSLGSQTSQYIVLTNVLYRNIPVIKGKMRRIWYVYRQRKQLYLLYKKYQSSNSVGGETRMLLD
jgi:hypothetical protein